MACSEGGEPVKRLSDIPLEIAERLDLPAESVAGVPKLTVTGVADLRHDRVCRICVR